MTKLSMLAFLTVAACACRDKAPATQEQAAPGPPPTTASFELPPDVPRLEGAGPKVVLDTLGAIVVIAQDGSLRVRRHFSSDSGGVAPGRDHAVDLAGLAKALELPEIAKRPPSVFGTAATPAEAAEAISSTDALFARLGHPAPATGVPAPLTRLSKAFALAHPHDVSAGIVVAAHPKASASLLVDVLAATGGFIAVQRAAGNGALPFAFDRQEPPWNAPYKSWTEIRLGERLELSGVPFDPLPVASPDRLPELAKVKRVTAVDVLVTPTTTVQELVSMLDQLPAAKIDAVGLGRAPAPGSHELLARGTRTPRVLAWDFYMPDTAGKTDPSTVRKTIDDALHAMHKCYSDMLAKTPALSAAATVRISVAPTGKATAETEAPLGLASCILKPLSAAKFPVVAAPGAKLEVKLAFVPE